MVTGQFPVEFNPEINAGSFFIQTGTPPYCKFLTAAHYKLNLQS
jgi:hypothetical protein